MKQLILTTVITILTVINLKAQTQIDTNYLMNLYSNTNYIFEGEVIEQCTFEDPSDGRIYTDNKIAISRFCKGQLNCGTVSVITFGGQFGDRLQKPTHIAQFNIGMCGIFLCNESPYLENSADCIASSDNPILTPTYYDNAYITYHTRLNGAVANGARCTFEELQTAYYYIQLFTGQPVIDCINSVAKSTIDKKYKQHKGRSVLPIMADNVYSTKKVRSNPLCKYGLIDSTITYDGVNKYLEFDFYVNIDDTIFVDTLSFNLITLNSQMFGSDLDASTSVTLNTTTLPSPKYILLPTIAIGTDSLTFIIVRTDTLLGTQLLPSFKYKIAHFKIEISDCYQYPKIGGGIPISTIYKRNFKLTSTDTISVNFGNTLREKSINQMNCEARINSIICNRTGTNVSAGGIGDTITIKGLHFGNNLGSIFVPNANGYKKWVSLEDYEQVSGARTDSTIKFIVNNFTTGQDYTTSITTQGIIGSGPVVVKNQWMSNVSLEFAKNLQVDYSLIQYSETSPFYKNNAYNISYNDSSYTFYRNANIPDSMRWVLKKAFKDWSCLTGINWKLSDSIKNKWDNSDTMCNIKIEPFIVLDSNTTPGVLIPEYRQCKNNTSNSKPVFFLHSMDIQLNPKFVSKYICDTTKTKDIPAQKVDFYRLCLHEIGHGHLQDHVSDSTDVMYYNNTNDPDLPTNAANRVVNLNISNQAGGDKIMASSTNILQHNVGNGCGYFKMKSLPTSCRLTLAINDTEVPKNDFVVFPNPTNGNIKLKFSKIISEGVIQIVDLNGKVLQKHIIQNKSNLELQYNCLHNTIYFIIVTDGTGITQTTKVLCD